MIHLSSTSAPGAATTFCRGISNTGASRGSSPADTYESSEDSAGDMGDRIRGHGPCGDDSGGEGIVASSDLRKPKPERRASRRWGLGDQGVSLLNVLRQGRKDRRGVVLKQDRAARTLH